MIDKWAPSGAHLLFRGLSVPSALLAPEGRRWSRRTAIRPGHGDCDVRIGCQSLYRQGDIRLEPGFSLIPGVNDVSITTPCGLQEGNRAARFRLSSAASVGVTGMAPDGEVEDYFVAVGADEPAIGVGTCLVNVYGQGASHHVEFDVVVGNYGNLPLADVEAELDLAAIFAHAMSWQVLSATSAELTLNPGFDGDGDVQLLAAGNGLAFDASGSVRLHVLVNPGNFEGPYTISALARGTSPSGIVVTDLSQDGCDPDPDGDADPANNNDATELNFFLPPLEYVPSNATWSLLLLALCFVLTAARVNRRGWSRRFPDACNETRPFPDRRGAWFLVGTRVPDVWGAADYSGPSVGSSNNGVDEGQMPSAGDGLAQTSSIRAVMCQRLPWSVGPALVVDIRKKSFAWRSSSSASRASVSLSVKTVMSILRSSRLASCRVMRGGKSFSSVSITCISL